MSVRVDVSANIDSVIADIEDVKRDLRSEMQKRVGAAMRVLLQDVRTYVTEDPHTTGTLLAALGFEERAIDVGIEMAVVVDAEQSPYAAIVEYGSGTRTNISFEEAPQMPPPDNPPARYPYEAPDIDNISGFAYYIEQWMRAKGLSPDLGSYRASSLAIAKSISSRGTETGTYAHPFMRPAWFQNELKVRKAARNAVRNAAR